MEGIGTLGEMHVTTNGYVGLAAVSISLSHCVALNLITGSSPMASAILRAAIRVGIK